MAFFGTGRSELRAQAVASLLAANTTAGSRVFTPQTWPQRPDQLPALIITTPAERKASLGKGLPRYFSTVSLAVLARVRGQGTDATSIIANAEAALDALCAQVEQAILGSPAFLDLVETVEHVELQMVVSAEGEAVIGEGSVVFGCQVYQEFQPDVGDPFSDAQITVPAAEPDGVALTVDIPITS